MYEEIKKEALEKFREGLKPTEIIKAHNLSDHSKPRRREIYRWYDAYLKEIGTNDKKDTPTTKAQKDMGFDTPKLNNAAEPDLSLHKTYMETKNSPKMAQERQQPPKENYMETVQPEEQEVSSGWFHYHKPRYLDLKDFEKNPGDWSIEGNFAIKRSDTNRRILLTE